MQIRYPMFALVFSIVPAYGQAQAPANVSPAEQKIAWAQKQIERDPKNVQAYSDLAVAYARRARETSDTRFYSQAEEALAKSVSISPDNFAARRAEVWILLGKHEFARARDKALALNQRAPDDVLIYGFLADANAELGNYDEAEKAAQWMLDIRPGNVPGLTRAAYLRELFGDVDGAIELMTQAYEQTSPSEVEDRAWILTQLAHLRLGVGDLNAADELVQLALKLYPQYHYALGILGHIRIGQEKYPAAVQLLRQRYQQAPHAENLYDLAEALERAGLPEEAREAYGQFEQKARHEIAFADNANRELIFYYADRAHRPEAALEIARLETERRHDVFTLDALAWALYANRQYAEGRRQIDAALAVGLRDAKLYYHAGAIALKQNDREFARRSLKKSLDLNSHSECAAAAKAELSSLEPVSRPVAERVGGQE